MKLLYEYHRDSDLVAQKPDFVSDYSEIENTLKDISDDDLIKTFNRRKLERPNIKSLSEPINFLIKERLQKLSWNIESGIFKEPPYNTTNSSRWRLDFVKNNISVEVAFNHGEAIAHNIMKPVLASELNHVQKEIQTKMGIIITATNSMKIKGGFDGAVGSFEKFIEYFKPYNMLIPTPIILIGIDEPKTFYIDKESKEVARYT
ncbi:hypothetical protein OAU92_00360 [Acidimicrobiia bacterium]|nr:hypothetical protein [Acidimicrobiia bacterium]